MLDQNTDLQPKPLAERREEPRPSHGEAPFDLSEVFFSRTDARGVIQAGNYVFRRVAHFEWDELIGAPHKLIRHADMPKGVFWLMWNSIQRGIPRGAYVKNRAQDGLHYWVFASVVPCEGGYLSARIKPVGSMRNAIEKEYADLLERETAENLTPEESGAVLLERLKAHGFEDYQRFEAHALSEELLARQRGMGLQEDAAILRHREMLDAAIKLKDATETLVREFETVRIIPHNMRAIASRLEPTGGPFRTLSSDYGSMSNEISDWFENNVIGENSNFSTISVRVNSSMFLDGVCKILDECDHQLQIERRKASAVDNEAERATLKGLAGYYRAQAESSCQDVAVEAERILAACAQMQRHILSLRTTRVLCKIESARMGASGAGLDDIIVQLGRFQEKIHDHLTGVHDLSEQIRSLAQTTNATRTSLNRASKGPARQNPKS